MKDGPSIFITIEGVSSIPEEHLCLFIRLLVHSEEDCRPPIDVSFIDKDPLLDERVALLDLREDPSNVILQDKFSDQPPFSIFLNALGPYFISMAYISFVLFGVTFFLIQFFINLSFQGLGISFHLFLEGIRHQVSVLLGLIRR